MVRRDLPTGDDRLVVHTAAEAAAITITDAPATHQRVLLGRRAADSSGASVALRAGWSDTDELNHSAQGGSHRACAEGTNVGRGPAMSPAVPKVPFWVQSGDVLCGCSSVNVSAG